MSRKKLTILTNWYLPGTKAGGPVRSIHSLIALLKDKFDVYLITSVYDLNATEPYNDIKADEWFKKDQVNYFYFSQNKLNEKGMADILTELQSDVIYINSFWSYLFAIYIVRLKNNGALNGRVILAPRGMLGKGALTIKPFKKQVYLFLCKLRGFYRHIQFHATNLREQADIQKHFPAAKIEVIENLSTALPFKTVKDKKAGQLKLFYLSRISPVKNLHLALELLGKVSDTCQIEYAIYGNIEDPAYWNHCLHLIKKLPQHIRVTFKGELPFQAVQETISVHHYLFLPTLNENYGHSIVESLMSSCPVIISDQTPWSDVEKENAGYAINLKDEAKFIQTIEYISRLDGTSYNKTSEAALNYISKKINLPLVTEKYIHLFNDAS